MLKKLSDLEKEPIIDSLNQCVKKIEILNRYFQLLSRNKEVTSELFSKGGNSINKEIFEQFFKNLENHMNELAKTLELAITIRNNIVESDEITNQYFTYLNNELLSMNWGKFNFVDDYNFNHITELLNKLNIVADVPLNNDDFNTVNIIKYLIEISVQFKLELVEKIASISIFKRIQYFHNNLVIVGPNGSGKSTFARSLKGKFGGSYTIISAQHLLIYDKPQNINLNISSRTSVNDFQKYNKLGSDSNLVELFKNDFSNLILALVEEKEERQRLYYDQKEERKVSILDKTIEIWETLITHRRIVQNDRYSLEVQTLEGAIYQLNQLSDGEKAIFYYIAHVLLAEENSYILIDEPENHLHLSICIKLWNILEQTRSDCRFIYITHNLDFAVSRNEKTLLWNKNFIPPFDWEVEEIKSDQMIPDIMLLEIMGSRRDVIFCEGDDRNSLDYKIYSRLFANYNVIPVNGHDNVINYCKSFNKNNGLSRMSAYGIVDGDTWTEAQSVSLSEDNIFVLPYNEIENTMCEEYFLKAVVNYTAGSGEDVIKFKEAFFKRIESEKNKIATWYANNRINNFLKHNLFKESKSIDDLKKEVEEVVSYNKIEEFYNEMLNRINSDIANYHYGNLLKYVNVKKILTRELANKYIIGNFEERFIKLLDSNHEFKELVKKELAEVYFGKLIKNDIGYQAEDEEPITS